MKYLLTFKESRINELVKNPQTRKFYADKISKDISKYINEVSFKYTFDEEKSVLEIRNIEEEDIPELTKTLNYYKNLLLKEDIILTFSHQKVLLNPIRKVEEVAKYGYYFTVRFKSKYSRRVKPQRYIYHFSPTSDTIRDNILRNGLIPMKQGDSSTWGRLPHLEYPNAIFAVNNDRDVWVAGYNIFRIDTQGLKNQWWEDFNFEIGTTDLIMTFEKIPPEHIELLGKEEIEKRRVKSEEFSRKNKEIEDKSKQELISIIKSGDFVSFQNKIKDLRNQKNKLPITVIMSQISKFGTVEMFKFVLENEVAPKGIFLEKLIRNAQTSNNNELVEYLKSLDSK